MLTLDLQIASDAKDLPAESDLQRWASIALRETDSPAEVTLRIVDEPECADLNQAYRGKQGPTNVLSFEFDLPPDVELPERPLGDLVICAPVVAREAAEQGKTLAAHWAHMVIHGMLHLQGFDHILDNDAEIMESLETQLMLQLGFPAPYEDE